MTGTEKPQQEPMDTEPSPFKEGKSPVPDNAWYTDGSSRGPTARWVAINVQPATDSVWFDTGTGQSS